REAYAEAARLPRGADKLADDAPDPAVVRAALAEVRLPAGVDLVGPDAATRATLLSELDLPGSAYVVVPCLPCPPAATTATTAGPADDPTALLEAGAAVDAV